MESVGVILFCQGFILPPPDYHSVREMALCDLSGKNHVLFSYDPSNISPSYAKLDNQTKETVDKAIANHGISYEPKYPLRSPNDLPNDFDEFIAEFGRAKTPDIGIWSGDEVAKSFLEGVGITPVLIQCDNLQLLPMGTVINEAQMHQYKVQDCAGHWKRVTPDNEDLETSHFHRCFIEFACALAALVRKETHFRSDDLLMNLLYQKNLWQARMEKFLHVVMCCSDCHVEMSRAFEKGEGLFWYPDCDTSPCCFLKSIFKEGVHDGINTFWNASDYQDSTLDTLAVLTPPTKF